MNEDPKGILLLTGTVGTGKTTVAVEIIEQLADMGLHCAVIDLDWLGWVNAGDDFHQYDKLIVQNVISVWPNYCAVGVEYLVLARGLTHREPVQTLQNVFSSTPIKVIRLIASRDILIKRLSQRDSGETLHEHLAEMNELNQIMDDLQLEEAAIVTDNLPVNMIAERIIDVTGWKK